MKTGGLIRLLKPYSAALSLLLLFALLSNGLNLVIPKLIETGIDDFTQNRWDAKKILVWFSLAVGLIFIFSYTQSIIQTLLSERVARDLRDRLAQKISQQSYKFINEYSPSTLLTNFTSDIDAVKSFISQAIVSIVSSIVLIIGATILLLNINLKLGLIVLLMIPIIAGSFIFVFKRLKNLFRRTQEVIDSLNKIINESILGSALIRVLNAQYSEFNHFLDANTKAKNLGLSILRLFATLIPIIVMASNLARLAVVGVGGYFVINSTMTLGEFAAFNSYIAILIFPILIIGFMSNVIARASASYNRIHAILTTPDFEDKGPVVKELEGLLQVENLSFYFGEKAAFKNVNFRVEAGERLGVIGPTGAGKTQLIYALIHLITPASGRVLYDNIEVTQYNQQSLLSQIGLVFQDSIIFNTTIRENIAFNTQVTDSDLQLAIETAELSAFIQSLPEGLDTVVSERGSTLSGGQKQRVMLARALAIRPKILLLDDFTARVDTQTERRITENLKKNYPLTTIVSVTQKINSIEDFDQIVLLMQGEMIASGTHSQLMKTCPEYVQIHNSQKSTNALTSPA